MSTRAAVIKAARANRPAPLVFASARPGSARPDRTDGVLAVPANADEARKLVEICIRTKIPTRVLIVDDSDTMRSIVRKILAASRFALDVHEAAEGIAALEQIASRQLRLGLSRLQHAGLQRHRDAVGDQARRARRSRW